MTTSLDELRSFAATHTLFTATTLARAVSRLGFVQADPIRAPARAQDLILRHRVKDYRVGDLDARYAKLGVSEDFFINYGFVTHDLQALMHPRPDVTVPTAGRRPWPAEQLRRARLLLRFVRERGEVHPREVDERFAQGKVTNYWGGTSNATTHLLDALHYRGRLRVTRREGGVRLYATHAHPRGAIGVAERRVRLDALVDVVAHIYSPLPAPSLSFYVNRLRYAVPQWASEVRAALQRAKARLERAHVDGVVWYWASGATRMRPAPEERVRLLAPFDPVVQDRRRFEILWRWVYRFEAYTPVAKRKLGYYALPLLWRDHVLGWANLAMRNGELDAQLGYIGGRPPRESTFQRELDVELDRVREFLRPREGGRHRRARHGSQG